MSHTVSMARPPRLRDEQDHPVHSEQRVNATIWRTAMTEAGGDPRRIRIISPTEVEVTVTP